jgi:hypothetical protein
MFISAILLLAAVLWYFPDLSKNLIIIIIGTFAFVFGMFSILMGYFQKDAPYQRAA